MVSLSGPSVPAASGGAPRQLVVLLHGVGANGEDLIGLAPLLARHLPDAAFHAPDAPDAYDMAPFGRQWFSLQDRRPSVLAAGIRTTAPQLDRYLDELLTRHGLEDRQLVLLGFSQGTMMALHVALRRERPVAGVLGFSGALLGGETLAQEARARPPVMLVHGDADEVVPPAAMQHAVAGLQAAGVAVRSLMRPGLPHSIDPEGLDAGARWLASLLPR